MLYALLAIFGQFVFHVCVYSCSLRDQQTKRRRRPIQQDSHLSGQIPSAPVQRRVGRADETGEVIKTQTGRIGLKSKDFTTVLSLSLLLKFRFSASFDRRSSEWTCFRRTTAATIWETLPYWRCRQTSSTRISWGPCACGTAFQIIWTTWWTKKER